MPVDQFTEEAFNRLAAGEDQIVIGSVGRMPKDAFDKIVDKRKDAFEDLAKMMRGE
jgi:hypothetical protein